MMGRVALVAEAPVHRPFTREKNDPARPLRLQESVDEESKISPLWSPLCCSQGSRKPQKRWSLVFFSWAFSPPVSQSALTATGPSEFGFDANIGRGQTGGRRCHVRGISERRRLVRDYPNHPIDAAAETRP